jgi:gas vesicle protein
MKTDKALLGIIGGVAVGAILGILLAPEKGSETRKKILNKGVDYTDDLKDQFNMLLGNLSKKCEQIKQKGSHLIADVKEEFEMQKNEMENAGNKF